MIKIFSVLGGMALVLFVGLTYAADTMPAGEDTGDKMIRNEDLSHIQLDPDRATLNQMPAESEIEGSAAGGMSSDADSMSGEVDQGNNPSDKGSMELGAGGAAQDADKWQKEKDMKGESSVDKGSEGAAAGGAGEEGATKGSVTYYRYWH